MTPQNTVPLPLAMQIRGHMRKEFSFMLGTRFGGKFNVNYDIEMFVFSWMDWSVIELAIIS